MCKQTYCYLCLNDCRDMQIMSDCENFILAPTIDEYWEAIHELNTDLKKICSHENLSFNIMMKMLRKKQEFSYRYHKCLIKHLFENEEYLPYILMEDNDGEK